MSGYERIDFENELRCYLRSEPFAPFDIVVTSGDRHEVKERDQVALGGNGRCSSSPHGYPIFSEESGCGGSRA